LGDLVYLEVTTLENSIFQITGWTHGFYVNSSTANEFNPNPKGNTPRTHALSDLLGKLSAAFSRNFKKFLAAGQFDRHPFELMPVAIPVIPWIGTPNARHLYDTNRAEYAILEAEIDFPGNIRDWNEEFRKCKELPKETVQDRIARDKNLVKVHNDFVQCATRGACAIVAGVVQPINPHQEEALHMYIYNNIFFSFANNDNINNNNNNNNNINNKVTITFTRVHDK